MIVYQSIILRPDLQANPGVLYVFGDNMLRMGFGGQAREMRGEPNAVGVATKKAPGGRPEDYFSDHEFDENMRVINADYARALTWHLSGGVVVVPLAGIGSGLSEMPSRCPRTYAMLVGLGLGVG